MLDFVVAGLSANSVPYLEGLALQRAIHQSVVSHERPDTIIFLEHESVYTAGKRTLPHERPPGNIEVIDVDRGGKITWHGPGQLIGYPIVHLVKPLDVVNYVRLLEEVLIDVVGDYGIDAQRVPGRSGVWIVNAKSTAKLAAIGVRVADGVTMHGFALNCSNSLDAYDHIVACGIADAGVTTLSKQLGVVVTPEQVMPAVQRRILLALAGAVNTVEAGTR